MCNFKRQFTDEEKVKWKNTLVKMFVQTGPDDLGLTFANAIGGDKFRVFDANINRTKPYNDIIVCSPIPAMAPSKPFSVCVEEKAQYIRSVIEERSLTPYLMWSGGLDSTGVMYALINEGLEFNVVFNQGSYKEYPKVAQELLDKKFKGITPIFANNGEFTLPEHADQNAGALYLTGEIGDQTFGSEGMYKFDYETRQLAVEDAVEQGHVAKELYDATIESVCKVTSGDITLAEYLWACAFIYKYQDRQLGVGSVGLRSYGPKQNTIHFFNSNEFQLYALNNYKENCNFVKKADYKMPLKEYIFKLNSDEDYFKNKVKEGSFFRGAYAAPY